MKLKRAVELNMHMDDLAGTSRGVYHVVDTPFIVVQDRLGNWFFCEKSNLHHQWMERYGLGEADFSTRASP